MLALDFLGVAFAWTVRVGVQMPGVGTPMIRVVAGQSEGLEQHFELQKDLGFAATKDVGQDLTGVVIDGMPEPAGVAFVPDKRLHCIHLRLCFPSALHVSGHLSGVQRAQQRGVHRLQHRGFLLECTQHGVGTDMQGSRCITHSTGIQTHVDDHVLDLRQASAVAIVEQKTALGTQGVLAEVALGSSGRFAAFDDLITLTVRAADGDERHGPFLPKRGYKDEAQCDINPSPSPLLKHYHRYIWQLTRAGFLSVPVPTAASLATLSWQVADNNNFPAARQHRDGEAMMTFLRRTIKHVVYMVKENRSYDKVLGDLEVGNGDPALAL